MTNSDRKDIFQDIGIGLCSGKVPSNSYQHGICFSDQGFQVSAFQRTGWRAPLDVVVLGILECMLDPGVYPNVLETCVLRTNGHVGIGFIETNTLEMTDKIAR